MPWIILLLLLIGIILWLVIKNPKNPFIMPSYPLPAYHFIADWGGSRIDFTEISGLDQFIEVIPVRQGGNPVPEFQKMPGLQKFNNITLKRGVVKGDDDFYKWINSQAGSTIERRDVLIKLLDHEHNPVFIWKVKSAFPIRYSGPVLKASGSEVAMEELELAHEGFDVIS